VTVAGIPTGLSFDHLIRLTDHRGLFEHAEFGVPRPDHGYCTDDVARGLVVLCREPDAPPVLNHLANRYLDFTLAAIAPDGRCHNRMNTAGRWTDRPALGDWWGRALGGLGVAAVRAPTAAMRERALLGFRAAARKRSPDLHAMAYAALGAGELLRSRPAEVGARRLLQDAVAAIDLPGSNRAWPWPQARLSYGNGSLVEALLLAGAVLPDRRTLAHGFDLLEFLLEVETNDGHFSVTPVAGRGLGDPSPAFDQQPIEVAALADACALASRLSDDPKWPAAVGLAWAWFLGDNDNGTRMFDWRTGAAFDGLLPVGCNLNQGAESTLAALSTAQHARSLGLIG